MEKFIHDMWGIGFIGEGRFGGDRLTSLEDLRKFLTALKEDDGELGHPSVPPVTKYAQQVLQPTRACCSDQDPWKGQVTTA